MSGDYTLEDSVYILFTTRAFATGIPGTLSAATVSVYEDVTATPIDTLIAVTEDLNSVTGLNAVTIAATAANGFNAGGHYHVVIDSASTVDSVSVQGEVVGEFSIEHSAAHTRLGAPAGASVSADIATAQADLDIITGASGVNLLTATQASIDAIETDTTTDIPALIATAQADLDDIQTRIPAALSSGNMKSDMLAISTSTSAADKLEASAGTIVVCTVDTVTNTHTPTTTVFQADDVTEATADHFIGRLVIFTSGVLINQASDITDYSAVGGIGEFTVTAMTEAPSNNDTFVIV